MTQSQLLVQIRGDTRQLDQELNRAREGVDRFASVQLRNLAAGIGAAFTVRGVSRFVSGVMQAADEVHNASRAARVGYEEYQALDAIMKENGATTQILQAGLRRVGDAATQARAGNQAYAESFRALGIDIAELQRLNPAQIIDRISAAMRDGSDDAQVMAAATDIVGRRYLPAMTQALGVLSEQGLKPLIEDLKATNRIMADETIRTFNEASNQMERFRQQLTVTAAGPISALAEGLTIINVAGHRLFAWLRGELDDLESARIRLRLDPLAESELQQTFMNLQRHVKWGVEGAQEELDRFSRGAERVGFRLTLDAESQQELESAFRHIELQAARGVQGAQAQLDALSAAAERVGISIAQLRGQGPATGALASDTGEDTAVDAATARIDQATDAYETARERLQSAREKAAFDELDAAEQMLELQRQIADLEAAQDDQPLQRRLQLEAEAYEIRHQAFRLQQRMDRDAEQTAEQQAREEQRRQEQRRRDQQQLQQLARDVWIAAPTVDAVQRIGGRIAGTTGADPERAIAQRHLEIAARQEAHLQRIAEREPGAVNP